MSVDTVYAKPTGAIIGTAIGDAVGRLAANGPPHREALLDEIGREPLLRYTDGTALTLLVAETLIEFGELDPHLLGNRFHELYHSENWRGYGDGMRRIHALVGREGIGYLDAAARLFDGAGSYGNRAVTRAVPLVLHGGTNAELAENIGIATRISHAHPIALDAAAVLAEALDLALALNPQRPFAPQAFLDVLITPARTREMRARLDLVAFFLDSATPLPEAARLLRLSAAAHESLPFALYCFLLHPHAFMECLLAAVLHGGDRPAMGAMAGALGGALLGIEAIPPAWRVKLENERHIEALARELAARGASADH
jgi:poly(ADP-ribose) glycohydrolase ARH3